MLETGARGDVGREGAVDGVARKGERGEIVETAEEGRKRAVDVEGREVERDDGLGGGVAVDTGPAARSRVMIIPVGERAIRVVEIEFDSVEIKAFLVKRQNREEEKEGEEEREQQLQL